MSDSVNWYFQISDQQTGHDKLQTFPNEISYGNKDITGVLSNYWFESSLLVSPLEQTAVVLSFIKMSSVRENILIHNFCNNIAFHPWRGM